MRYKKTSEVVDNKTGLIWKSEDECDPVFNMKPTNYWSCSPNAYDSGYGWFVGFGDGGVDYGGRGYDELVRSVRTVEKNNEV